MSSQAALTVGELPADVLAAVKSGRRIEAIRLLREQTGLGLANAKVLVDTAARQHGVPTVAPAQVKVKAIPVGLLKTLIIVALAATIYWYFDL